MGICFFHAIHIRRPLTPKDIALKGLNGGKSAPLEIVSIKGKGNGIVALAPISKGSFITDYKYSVLHTSLKAKMKAEQDYIVNEEGCYILEARMNNKTLYFDATRRFNSYGRYVNVFLSSSL